MTRLRTIVTMGVISDDPLSSGATTVNSTGFDELPTVAGSDDLLITLDHAVVEYVDDHLLLRDSAGEKHGTRGQLVIRAIARRGVRDGNSDAYSRIGVP